MAGDNAKPYSNKRPPSSSSTDRKSRWESSSPVTVANPSSDPAKSSKSTAPGSSDSKRTPRLAPNPSPAHPNLSPAQARPSFPPGGPPFLFPDPPPPPPPPSYGFHMLDRRTLVLADGSVRSYFALPLDYQDLPFPPPRPPLDRFIPGGPEMGRNRGSQEYWNSLGLDGRGPEGSMKRKFGEGDEGDELARRRKQLLQYGNAGANSDIGPSSSPFRRDNEFRSSKHMRIGGEGGFENNVGEKQEVDPAVLKAFLNYAKLINENGNQRKNYLDNGKHGPLQCLACGRSSKDFPDVHSLTLHAYTSDNADLRVDHLGLHRALCVLMGWNYMRPPDNSKVYHFLPADEAAANQDDLILWPPTVIIHNTNTGKGKDGRMEGLGNKTMDNKMRDLGFPGGKSKSLYCRDGHLGITLIKFASDQSGLKEAMRLADHFEQGHHGRRHWAHVQPISSGKDDESNPNLMLVDERTGERRRILYGYLGTASDMDKLDYETRKKIAIESKYEKLQPPK